MFNFIRLFQSHELMLAKLGYCGVSNVCVQWFRSYLSGRMQSVKTVKWGEVRISGLSF